MGKSDAMVLALKMKEGSHQPLNVGSLQAPEKTRKYILPYGLQKKICSPANTLPDWDPSQPFELPNCKIKKNVLFQTTKFAVIYNSNIRKLGQSKTDIFISITKKVNNSFVHFGQLNNQIKADARKIQ